MTPSQDQGADAPATLPADLEALIAKAKAATGGTWSVVPYGDGDSLVIHSGEDWRVCFMATPGDSPRGVARIEANAAYIAAASPDVVLSLCEEIKRLRASSVSPASDGVRELNGKIIQLGRIDCGSLSGEEPNYRQCALVEIDRDKPMTMKFDDVWKSSPVRITTSAALAKGVEADV